MKKSKFKSVMLGKPLKAKKVKAKENPMKFNQSDDDELTPPPKNKKPEFGEVFDGDDDLMPPKKKMKQKIQDEETLLTPKAKGAGPRFSPAEDQFIIDWCDFFEGSGTITIENLNMISGKCNKRFHDNKPQRTGESLWWHIKREQKRGNPLFMEISISGGTPKQRWRAERRVREDGSVAPEITSSIKATPTKPVSVKANPKPNHNQSPKEVIEVLVKDMKGNIQKFKTSKFATIEELMFALG